MDRRVDQYRLQRIAEAAAARKQGTVRRKCFVSYHTADRDQVAEFLDEFGSEFIAKTVGVTDEDDFIESDDTGYVMDRIRTKYLGDSTVTLALMGACTWARRYVDWEIYSSLRSSKHSSVNGLLAVALPNSSGTDPRLQQRIADNLTRDADGIDVGYARWYTYPNNTSSLKSWIEDAYLSRTLRPDLIDNTRPRRIRSAKCP